jgi:hypothetical protein
MRTGGELTQTVVTRHSAGRFAAPQSTCGFCEHRLHCPNTRKCGRLSKSNVTSKVTERRLSFCGSVKLEAFGGDKIYLKVGCSAAVYLSNRCCEGRSEMTRCGPCSRVQSTRDSVTAPQVTAGKPSLFNRCTKRSKQLCAWQPARPVSRPHG